MVIGSLSSEIASSDDDGKSTFISRVSVVGKVEGLAIFYRPRAGARPERLQPFPRMAIGLAEPLAPFETCPLQFEGKRRAPKALAHGQALEFVEIDDLAGQAHRPGVERGGLLLRAREQARVRA